MPCRRRWRQRVFRRALLAARETRRPWEAAKTGAKARRGCLSQTLRKHDRVVYAKPPARESAQVLDYLVRYTHRVAISNDRILCVEEVQIRLRVRHVLPRRSKRIRHYGAARPRHTAAHLAQARAALHATEPQTPAIETAPGASAPDRVARSGATRNGPRPDHAGAGRTPVVCGGRTGRSRRAPTPDTTRSTAHAWPSRPVISRPEG